MKLSILFGILFALFLLPVSFAAYSLNGVVPNPYSIQNATTVTFNVNVTGGNENLNCSIYTKMASGDSYTLNKSFGVVNTSTVTSTTTIDFTDGDRVWYKIGCWDRPLNTSIVDESVTMSANLSQIDFTYDSDGVGTGTGGLVGYVNYTQDETNEEANMVVNNSISTVDLNGNNSISSVTSAKASNGTVNFTLVSGTDYYISSQRVYINSSTYGTNTSWWTYTHINNTLLVDGTDYSVTDGIMIANYSSKDFTGDVSEWNYSYPYDSYVNEVNTTTVRIFDVDVDYQTLYFGSAELISMVLYTGAFAAINVTADNINVNKNITFDNGARIDFNTTCLILHSPDGSGRINICDA